MTPLIDHVEVECAATDMDVERAVLYQHLEVHLVRLCEADLADRVVILEYRVSLDDDVENSLVG